MTRRRIINGLLALAVVGAGVAVWATVGASASTKSSAPVTYEATNGTVLSTVSASGTVAAAQQVNVSFTTGGTLTEIDVKNGDHVTAGQVLAQVDPASAQSSLDLAQAQLTSAQSQLTSAQNASSTTTTAQTTTAGSVSSGSSASSAQQQQAQSAYDSATAQVNQDVAFAQACQGNPSTPPADGLTCATVASRLEIDLAAQQSAQSQLTVALAAAGASSPTASSGTSSGSSSGTGGSSGSSGSTSSVAQAEASVLSAQNQVDAAQKALDGTTLDAPADGTVSGLTAQVGGTVSGGTSTSSGAGTSSSATSSGGSSSGGASGGAGSGASSGASSASSSSSASGTSSSGSTFLVLTNLDALDVQAAFTEADAVKVHVGQKVIVTFSALPDVTVQGEVSQIATTATTSNGVVSFAVVVSLDQTPDGLRPGMTANAPVVVDEADDVLLVPSSAISGTGNTSTVTVIGADGKEVSRTVTIGLRGDSSVEITSGLEKGEKIVRTTTTTASTSTGSTTGSRTGSSTGSGSGTLGGSGLTGPGGGGGFTGGGRGGGG